MKKRDLERALQSLESVPTPRSDIEQYATPPGIAAEVAYIALGRGDLVGRTVLDAGCGNGILAIAAALCGAARVTGIDVDPEAIDVARRNGRRLAAEVEWRVADVREARDRVDTVLMNPPFGSQKRHADLPFLDRALDLGAVVYSFHNAKTEAFLARRIANRGGRVSDRIEYAFPIPRTFPFHRADERRVPVVLVRVESAKG
jgi:putative methylase